jgi:hypothetical protein
MTNAPEPRKTHVVRLVGTNSDGDVLQDIWIDVERIDQFTITTQIQISLPRLGLVNRWQEVIIRLKWRDDPTDPDRYIPEDKLDADQDQNIGRVHEIIKVCSPDEDDLENPTEWVAIKTIKHIDMRESDLDTQKRFVAKIVDAKGRKINPRRIDHYDTNIDDKAQAAFDADETLKAYVAVGHDNKGESAGYERDDSTKDEDQYIEHEVIELLSRNDSDHEYSTGGQFQEVQLKLKNQYLIDESAAAQLKEQGPDGINPPYRLDPFQNIINVQLGALAVEFGDKDKAPPSPPLPALPM